MYCTTSWRLAADSSTLFFPEPPTNRERYPSRSASTVWLRTSRLTLSTARMRASWSSVRVPARTAPSHGIGRWRMLFCKDARYVGGSSNMMLELLLRSVSKRKVAQVALVELDVGASSSLAQMGPTGAANPSYVTAQRTVVAHELTGVVKAGARMDSGDKQGRIAISHPVRRHGGAMCRTAGEAEVQAGSSNWQPESSNEPVKECILPWTTPQIEPRAAACQLNTPPSDPIFLPVMHHLSWYLQTAGDKP